MPWLQGKVLTARFSMKTSHLTLIIYFWVIWKNNNENKAI
jgi:hypothetical protein